MAKFIDAQGATQEVGLSTTVYREAQERGQTVEAYINSTYETAAGDAPAFDQMVASLGISLQTDPSTGIKASKISDILSGKTVSAANTSQGGGAPESRIIFPAAVLAAVEDKLTRDLTTAANTFDSLVALSETIPGNQFVQVVMNFDGPEKYTPGATAQLARPQNMLLMTAAERPGVIPVESSGVEWSDQFAQGTTIDFLALSVARAIAKQRDRAAHAATLALLNGDEDAQQAALPAAYRVKANTLDTSITSNGEITQTAWVKWLYKDGDVRQITHVITDIDTAIAIENRKGKPVIVGDDPNSPRIDSQMRIANPVIPAEVQVFVTRNPDWPAGTVLGLDRRYGIRRITSLSANYEATEQDVIRRANAMRWDSGSIVMRMWDEAFSVLELTV